MEKKPGSIILTAGLAALCCWEFWYYLVFTLMDADTAWLIRTGDYILDKQVLPVNDIFSWTLPDRPYICYQWLFDVVLSVCNSMGSVWGVGLFASVVAGSIIFYFLPRIWLKEGVPLNITLFFLLLTMTPTLFLGRPQLISYLLIIGFITILERFRLGKSKPWEALLLIPATALWANMHSFCVVGMALIACYAIDALFSKALLKAKAIFLFLVLAGASLAVLLNPYGTGLVPYIFSFAGKSSFNIIGELGPLWGNREPFFVLINLYLLLLWVLLLRNRNAVPRVGFWVSAAASIAAISIIRFCTLAVICSWFYLGMAIIAEFKKAGKSVNSESTAALAIGSRIAFPVVICLASLLWYLRVPEQNFAMHIFADNNTKFYQYMQSQQSKFVDANDPKDQVFNDPNTGAFLIYFGLGPVFIDNRFNFYGKEFGEDWFSCWSAEPGWEKYLADFKKDGKSIGRAVIRNNGPMYEALMRSPNWLLAYDDRQNSIWLTNTEKHKRAIQELLAGNASSKQEAEMVGYARATTIPSIRTKHVSTGNMLLNDGKIQECINEFKQALSEFPEDPELHHHMIHALAVAGRRDELANELYGARKLFADAKSENDPHAWAEHSADTLVKKYEDSPVRKRISGKG